VHIVAAYNNTNILCRIRSNSFTKAKFLFDKNSSKTDGKISFNKYNNIRPNRKSNPRLDKDTKKSTIATNSINYLKRKKKMLEIRKFTQGNNAVVTSFIGLT
jgi:hypothetical protein